MASANLTVEYWWDKQSRMVVIDEPDGDQPAKIVIFEPRMENVSYRERVYKNARPWQRRRVMAILRRYGYSFAISGPHHEHNQAAGALPLKIQGGI